MWQLIDLRFSCIDKMAVYYTPRKIAEIIAKFWGNRC